MRKVMFAMNISIDGCYDHNIAAPDEELMEYFTQLMIDTGLIVYGRKTYEMMVPYWPDVAESRSGSPGDLAFADAMVPIPKIVLSRALMDETPEALLRRLKQQPGKKIAFSSTSLLPAMLKADLIDELYLVVHPLLAGEGKRLFTDFLSPEKLHFKLQETKLFKSGVIALHYGRV